MSAGLKYLLDAEWSVGNGQCPGCMGVSPVFLSWKKPADIGHRLDCGHAAAIVALGGKPLMLGECPPPDPDSRAAFAKRHWDALNARLTEDVYFTALADLYGGNPA